jgi:hypothetical protein
MQLLAEVKAKQTSLVPHSQHPKEKPNAAQVGVDAQAKSEALQSMGSLPANREADRRSMLVGGAAKRAHKRDGQLADSGHG